MQGSDSYKLYCTSLTADHHNLKSCLDLRCKGSVTSGVYTIYPTEDPYYSVQVFCDQETDGGGWTVSISQILSARFSLKVYLVLTQNLIEDH